MKKILKNLRLGILVFIAFIIVAGRTLTVMIHIGGGQGKDSPNGKYIASAYDYNNEDFWGIQRPYYEFLIEHKNAYAGAPAIKKVRIDCLAPCNKFSMRGGPRIISWDEGSTVATFKFQEIELKIHLDQ